ncbi:MAG: OmpA family protein [Acidobacteria bacterium]|nr:OmpA family protein [Acidobacteriota bacterium]
MKQTLVSLIVAMAAAWAQPAAVDKPGCAESGLVSRMPGCVITQCEKKAFAAADMPRTQNERGHMVEGEYERTVYKCPKEKSPLELGRNTEAALKQAGYKIHYTYLYATTRFYMTAQKGGQWVRLTVMDYYELVSVKEKEMEQVMTANADGWAQQIGKEGRVSVYGINFDTGKATIRPDSEAALNEVLKLLQANPGWAMMVAGHTDNVGTQAVNLPLSRQRAQAVIAWLAAKGVAESRLVPAGFGDARPVAENSDEAGRQKNRRVDLVKVY